jgi:hypothetical protein
MLRLFPLAFFPLLASALHAAPIERLWLAHAVNDSARLTVNWETDQPGPSLVEYGTDETLGEEANSAEPTTLHHVEIALDPDAPRHYYRVRSGADESAIYSVKGYTGETIRVGPFADRGYARDRFLLRICFFIPSAAIPPKARGRRGGALPPLNVSSDEVDEALVNGDGISSAACATTIRVSPERRVVSLTLRARMTLRPGLSLIT